MLSTPAYLAGRHSVLLKLGAATVPSLSALRQQMTANASNAAHAAAKPVAETAGTMAHALTQTPRGPTLRGPAQAKIDVALHGKPLRSPAPAPVGNHVSEDLLRMPAATLPPGVPATSPYGVSPVRKPSAPEQPTVADAAATGAASKGAPGYAGPFPKLKGALTSPKVLAGLGLTAGGGYALNAMSQDPNMSVTPSAPLAYYP